MPRAPKVLVPTNLCSKCLRRIRLANSSECRQCWQEWWNNAVAAANGRTE